MLSQLPVEILLIIFSMLDETTKAICMHVCCEWRTMILDTPGKSIVPRIFAEDMVRSVSLLLWQRNILDRPFNQMK